MELKKKHNRRWKMLLYTVLNISPTNLKNWKRGMQKYKLLKKLHLRWCFVTTYAVEHNPVLFYSLDFHNIAQV